MNAAEEGMEAQVVIVVSHGITSRWDSAPVLQCQLFCTLTLPLFSSMQGIYYDVVPLLPRMVRQFLQFSELCSSYPR